MGLCYKCASKWSKDHKCPLEVLLPVETVWDSLLPDEDESEQVEEQPFEEVCAMAISKATTSRTAAACTV